MTCEEPTPNLPAKREKKKSQAIAEALVCTHQFICYLRALIKEKWCEALSWVNAYYTTAVGNGAVR